MKIRNVRDLMVALRAGKYTSVGSYPVYFVTDDGDALSFNTVRAELGRVARSVRDRSSDGWRVIAVEVNYEDPELYCDHSNERIESAYAEPETV